MGLGCPGVGIGIDDGDGDGDGGAYVVDGGMVFIITPFFLSFLSVLPVFIVPLGV